MKEQGIGGSVTELQRAVADVSDAGYGWLREKPRTAAVTPQKKTVCATQWPVLRPLTASQSPAASQPGLLVCKSSACTSRVTDVQFVPHC